MATETHFRVASLNLWGRKGEFEARMDIVRNEISRLSPDVIFLQEVLLSQGRHRLVEELKMDGYCEKFDATIKVGRGNDYGNALLSRLEARACPTLRLLTPKGVESRNVVVCEITISGRKGLFLSTHLSHGVEQGEMREAQLQEVIALASKGDFSILGGDFNMEPLEFQRFASSQQREIRDAHCDDEHMYEYEYAKIVKSNATSVSRGINEKLDYIVYFSSLGIDLNVTNRGFFACEPVGGVFPSDHIGIYGDFRLVVGN